MPPGLALLYRHYPLTLENTLAHFLLLLLQFFFLCLFLYLKTVYFVVVNSYVGNKVDLTWLVQMKKENSMNYDGSSKSSWKRQRWVRLVLMLIMRDIYINSSMNPLTKFTNNSRSTAFKDMPLYRICPPMEYLSNDHEGCSNRNENSHKFGSKTGPVLSLTESQWKLRQQNDQNIPMEWKPL